MDGTGGVKAYDKSLERHHRLDNSSIVVVVRLPAKMKYVRTFVKSSLCDAQRDRFTKKAS